MERCTRVYERTSTRKNFSPERRLLRTFEDVRRHFLHVYWRRAGRQPRWFSGQRPKSLPDAVSRAARSEVPSKKNPERMVLRAYQRKVGWERLGVLAEKLGRDLRVIGAARSFDALYGIVERVTCDIDGIGELTTYEVALRLAPIRNLSRGERLLARRDACWCESAWTECWSHCQDFVVATSTESALGGSSGRCLVHLQRRPAAHCKENELEAERSKVLSGRLGKCRAPTLQMTPTAPATRPRKQSEARRVLKAITNYPCCAVCGLTLETCLTVAHLDHQSANNTPDNLAWLCWTHHWMYDCGSIRGTQSWPCRHIGRKPKAYPITNRA